MVVNNLNENIASMSSGLKDLSTQLTTHPTDHKPISSVVNATPITPTTPSDTSNASGTSSSSSILLFTRLPLPQLDQKNHPNVRHWTSNDYKGSRKVGKSGIESDSVGETPGRYSILSCYMEDENGGQIPKAKKNAAREAAKDFFNLLLDNGRAPSVWGDASMDVKNELIHILESGFPFLRLCDDHWKAKKIATNSYSQWYLKALKRRAAALAKQAAIKGVIDVDANTNDTNKPSKRPRAEDDKTNRSKRPRVEEIQPTSPHPRPAIITTERQRVRNPLRLTLRTADKI